MVGCQTWKDSLYQDPAPLIMRRRNENRYHSINSIVMSVECLKLEFIRVIKRKKAPFCFFLPINATRLIRFVVDSVHLDHWNSSQILEYFVVSLAVTISCWCYIWRMLTNIWTILWLCLCLIIFMSVLVSRNVVLNELSYRLIFKKSA